MSNEARAECARRLQELREAKGLTRAQLGALAGVTQVAVWRWEADERMPTFETRLLLTAALGEDPYAIEPAEGVA